MVVRVPVFYATDREKVTSNLDSEGCKLGEFTTGCATVLLPKCGEWFDSTQLKSDFASMGWKLDDDAEAVEPFIEVRGYVAEPIPEKVLTDVRRCGDFWSALQNQAENFQRKCVYIYIHGFASGGYNSLYTAGILSSRLEAPVVAFSWPSEGTAGLKPLQINPLDRKFIRNRYLRDRGMVDRKEVMEDLKTFVRTMRDKLPSSIEICLVAHSLGNRLMSRYLCSDAKEKFASVYFLAADVVEELFLQTAKTLRSKSKYSAV